MDNPSNVDKPNKVVEAGRGVPSEATDVTTTDSEPTVAQTKNRLDDRVRKAGI